MPANEVTEQLTLLRDKVQKAQLPPELSLRTLARLERIEKLGASIASFDEIDRTTDYIDWIAELPWNVRSTDILDLPHAKEILDKNHFGLEDIKARALEFISVLKLNQDRGTKANAPTLCFIGLAGTGKTTIAYSIAEALGKKFFRIPLGGMGDTLELRGLSKSHSEAEPGRIIKALRSVKVRNPVILLDEIDRVDENARASVMGILLELLDPEQNSKFMDYFVDFPFDLSETLFITTGNNTTNIATAVLDRLEVIHMPSYTDEEKINIGRNYMLPRVVRESGLPDGTVQLDETVWPSIVRPLGFDAGMRTLERTIDGIVRKVAREYVEGKTKQIKLTSENIKEYLPQF